jgi:hypothetical protein
MYNANSTSPARTEVALRDLHEVSTMPIPESLPSREVLEKRLLEQHMRVFDVQRLLEMVVIALDTIGNHDAEPNLSMWHTLVIAREKCTEILEALEPPIVLKVDNAPARAGKEVMDPY